MIRNCISDCYDGNGKPLDTVDHLIVHHCSLRHHGPGNSNPIEDRDLTGPELAKRFLDKGLGTGGRCPYHFLILSDGRIDQLLPLDVRGAHTPGYNYRSIAISTVGEHLPPARSQVESLVKVLTGLVLHTRGAWINGHMYVAPSPGKICPHPDLDMKKLRAEVSNRLPPDWRNWTRSKIDLVLSSEGFTQHHAKG